jgi:hypothetical protein
MDELSGPNSLTQTNIPQPDQIDPGVFDASILPVTTTELAGETALPVSADISDAKIVNNLTHSGTDHPERSWWNRRSVHVLGATAVIGGVVAALLVPHKKHDDAPQAGPNSTVTTSQYSALPDSSLSTSPSVPAEQSSSVPKHTSPASPPPVSSASSAPETQQPSVMTYEDLPGFGKEASKADIEKLRASTVEIVTRDKTDTASYGWLVSCMGTKITYEGKTYIMSARHCFAGLPKEESFANAQAQDVSSVGNLNYGIRSIGTPDGPVAIVSSTVVGQRDFMLQILRAPDKNDPTYADDQAGYEAFMKIPSVSYDPNKTIDGAPLDAADEIGGLGSASSFTAESGGKIVNTPGVYLGVLKDPNAADPNSVDVYYQYWAEKVASPASDACYYGDSGLAYLSPSGGLAGPESTRINLKHDANDDAAPNPSLSQRQGFVHNLEQQLSKKYGRTFSLSGFDMICGTTVVTPNYMQNAVNAFQAPAAKLPTS